MKQPILGIHHVTAIAGDPQRNLDFYTDALGLRLVKLTVNFDDPGTYHFYFGDETGAPGTILTFFPYPGAARGRHGAGQAGAIAFAVPEGALGYWSKRLEEYGVSLDKSFSRFGQRVLAFADPDGLRLELVEAPGEAAEPWQGGSVPVEYAIRGFFGITLVERQREATVSLLTETMGLRLVGQEGDRTRYQGDEAAPGAVVDVLDRPDEPHGIVAVGSVHHVAWRTPDDDQQADWRNILAGQGFDVSPVMDRIYFHSIYFRDPGGVLFEIATDTPGFAIDETPDALGEGLRLPPWLEPQRARIEQATPPLRMSRLEGRGVS